MLPSLKSDAYPLQVVAPAALDQVVWQLVQFAQVVENATRPTQAQPCGERNSAYASTFNARVHEFCTWMCCFEGRRVYSTHLFRI